jgi:hypothetical protein
LFLIATTAIAERADMKAVVIYHDGGFGVGDRRSAMNVQPGFG